MSANYVIIEADDLPDVDFSDIMEASADTLRYSLDKSQFIVKYMGNKPRWLYGKTTHTHTEILAITLSAEWEPANPEGV